MATSQSLFLWREASHRRIASLSKDIDLKKFVQSRRLSDLAFAQNIDSQTITVFGDFRLLETRSVTAVRRTKAVPATAGSAR
jgi:hypothetical protein